jgi:hypothetical protein
MEIKLVQKQIIPHKNSFRKELNEIILSLDLPKYPNHKGNKQFTTAQRLSCVILYIRLGKSLRDFCEEFKETQWPKWLELRYEIKKSSLNSWLKQFDLSFIKKLLDQTNSGEKPEVLGIDGTGIDTQFKSSYYQKRLNDFGQKQKSNYHKLDIIADMNGKKKIFDFSFLMKQQHDLPIAWQLIKRLKFKNLVIVADKGYFDFSLFNFVQLNNNHLLFPPKNFGGKCVHNNILHRKIKTNYHKYIDIYHKRSNVEGIFSALKRTILKKIVSRNCSTKKREMGFKIVLYNMKKNIFFIFNFQYKNFIFLY